MQISRILIGIDDSKFADNAAAYGFSLAQKFNAHVGLVHIVEPIVSPINTNDSITGLPFGDTGINEVEMLAVQENIGENLVERTIKKYAGDLEVTHFSEYGATADGILHCSKEFKADLIVVGTHSRSGFDRLLMGSVAESVVRHAEVPVLVVPFQ
ncbi:universal stress protein [Mucilaginibacter psychrotolerans]|uniref:Universal stress protein n=1 Tax=Mucilaginibacter psychrotolerans TaxID=1524096 RepID=A0A4Y8S839_9SPHI|nr:universal stress protein [Mucilaginibacter psychrotolerans]TFF35169.1 universal stress protein [Mucilaginibacter psychrotolerans]